MSEMLHANQHGLISNLDVHETLHYLTSFTESHTSRSRAEKWRSSTSHRRRYNIAQQLVPLNRTCAQAHIAPGMCKCHSDSEVVLTRNQTLYVEFAKLFLDEINAKPGIVRGECQRLKYSEPALSTRKKELVLFRGQRAVYQRFWAKTILKNGKGVLMSVIVEFTAFAALPVSGVPESAVGAVVETITTETLWAPYKQCAAKDMHPQYCICQQYQHEKLVNWYDETSNFKEFSMRNHVKIT